MTHTDHAGLYAAVLAAPADDALRIILADWYDEHEAETGGCVHCQLWLDFRSGITPGVPIPTASGSKCVACAKPLGSGAARKSNGYAARAEYIRVAVELARLADKRVEYLNEETDWRECSPLSADWCPNCGDCKCPNREDRMDDAGCPLHAPASRHCCLENLEDKFDRLRLRDKELFDANWERWDRDRPTQNHFRSGLKTTWERGWPAVLTFALGWGYRGPLVYEDAAIVVASEPIRRVEVAGRPEAFTVLPGEGLRPWFITNEDPPARQPVNTITHAMYTSGPDRAAVAARLPGLLARVLDGNPYAGLTAGRV